MEHFVRNYYKLKPILTDDITTWVGVTAFITNCILKKLPCFLIIIFFSEETNDSRKAEAVWTKMQEENIIPRERTLRMVADILRSNGEEVPFDVPEVKKKEEEEVQVYCFMQCS